MKPDTPSWSYWPCAPFPRAVALGLLALLALSLLALSARPAAASPAGIGARPEAATIAPPASTPLVLAHAGADQGGQSNSATGQSSGGDDQEAPPTGLKHFIWWIGHFHPAMTVFPIGLLMAAALAELLFILTRTAWLEGAARFCLIVAAVGAAVTAPLGWAFAMGHGHWRLLEIHRWLGTAGACWLVALLVVSEVYRRRAAKPETARTWRGLYRAGLFLAVPAVAATGYCGGAMVYGTHEYDWQPRTAEHAESQSSGAAGGPSSSAPASQPSSHATHGPAQTVTMTDDMTFKPAALTVTAGTTVRWTNPSTDTHTVTADPKKASDAKDVSLPAGAPPFHSGDVKPGGTYEHTFTVPGTYKYVCVPHEGMGMSGTVVVKPGP